MLAFMANIAFSLELLALTAGITLLIWSFRNEGKGVMLASVFGYIVIILAISALLCTSYFAVKSWKKGSCCHPQDMSMQMEPMNQKMGMPNMMMPKQSEKQNKLR